MYTVYMHECPNGKRYVGITSRSCKKRWNCGYGYFNNPAFDEDIKKYGWENVKHFVLKQCEDADEGYEAEKYYIKLYDTTNTEKGYNHSTGGKNSSEGFRHTEDAKEKIAEASRGRKRSKESIEKVAKARRKKVKVYDLHLNLIKICDSLVEAEKLTGISNSLISATCKGKYKQIKGYVFRYADDNTPLENPKLHRKPVNMYALDGTFIREWGTIKEAAIYFGIAETHISDCCKGKYSQSGGYKWEYA